MRREMLVLVVALLPLAAENPKQKLDQTDDQLLQGTWVVTNWLGFAKESTKEDLKGLHLVIKGNRIHAEYGEKKTAEATFKLNAARTHRQIDVTLTEGPEVVKGKTFLGIYLVEGPVLRVAFSDPGQDRPMDFGSPGKTKVHQIDFSRKTTR